MQPHPVVDRAQWLEARQVLLAEEKAFTRSRDALAAARQALPWVKVEKDYRFDSESGPKSLGELFAGKSQLLVYHFMFGEGWEAGCPSCSLIAEGFDGIVTHLAQRDVAFVAASRAPLATLLAYRARLGWHFPWVSSGGSDLNRDFAVGFTAEEIEGEVTYNYAQRKFPVTEAPGLSVFARDDGGAVFHTYSTYARGLDPLMGVYQYLDLVPKGRDEAALPWAMAWVRRHDEY
jgi:predicted dithiol-disulfide oxidoreductase (DUF899 family)